MKHKSIPAMPGPKYVPKRVETLKYDLAMQEAIRRSERQPKLIGLNGKDKGAR